MDLLVTPEGDRSLCDLAKGLGYKRPGERQKPAGGVRDKGPLQHHTLTQRGATDTAYTALHSLTSGFPKTVGKNIHSLIADQILSPRGNVQLSRR